MHVQHDASTPDPNAAHRNVDAALLFELLHPEHWPLLAALAEADRTVTDLCASLNLPMSHVHYRLGRLHRAGVIKVARTQPRAGRPIRHYRLDSTHWHASTPDLPADVLLEVIRRHLAAATRQVLDAVTRELQAEGHARLHVTFDPRAGMRLSLNRHPVHVPTPRPEGGSAPTGP